MDNKTDTLFVTFMTAMYRRAHEVRAYSGRLFCEDMIEGLARLLAEHVATLTNDEINMVIALGAIIRLHLDREDDADKMIDDFLFRSIVNRSQQGGAK